MNPWIFPGLALLVTGGWIGFQKKTANSLEKEITTLTERIRLVHAGEDAGGRTREAEEKARKAKDKKIDWRDLSAKIGTMRNGSMPDMRSMMRLQKILLDMSAAELAAQLDEIATLGLEDSARKQLESMITGALADKDPKLVLDRFARSGGGDESSWLFSNALRKWAETEPAAAVAWLDQQIAAGKLDSKSLDGRSQTRFMLEGAAVNSLLKSDPAAASARVGALPEDQRQEFLQQNFYFQPGKENDTAYAKLVRDNLKDDQTAAVFANMAGNLAMNGGYDRVDSFIAGTKATDNEKKAIVAEAIKDKMSRTADKDVNVGELDKARAWGAGQSPGVVDKATGEALASTTWRGVDFEKASGLALKYNESSPNDDVLAAFLKSNRMRHGSADKTQALIDKIKDPALREEIRKLPQYNN